MELSPKALVKNLLRSLPGKRALVDLGGNLHPVLKGLGFGPVFGAVAKGLPGDTPVVTNLGIKPEYRVRLSYAQGSVILFGSPLEYVAERGALHLARCLAADAKAFIDVGANHGYYEFFLRAENKSIPIYYFEPNPRLFRELKENFERNGLPGLHGSDQAVGSKTGKATFHVDLTDDCVSSLKESGGSHLQKYEVSVTSFDDFIDKEGLGDVLLKVDIENAEFDFLEGAAKGLSKVKYLIMELLMGAVKQGFIQEMISLGWHAYYINNFLLEYSAGGHFEYNHPQYNYFFCRLSPEELKPKLEGSRFSLGLSRKIG